MGKGGGSSSTPTAMPTMPTVDTSSMTNMINSLQASNMQAILDAQSTMNNAISKLDDKEAEVNSASWAEKVAALKAKVNSDMTEIAARKRGRASTIVTSPLNDEDVKTTGSILEGK